MDHEQAIVVGWHQAFEDRPSPRCPERKEKEDFLFCDNHCDTEVFWITLSTPEITLDLRSQTEREHTPRSIHLLLESPFLQRKEVAVNCASDPCLRLEDLEPSAQL